VFSSTQQFHQNRPEKIASTPRSDIPETT